MASTQTTLCRFFSQLTTAPRPRLHARASPSLPPAPAIQVKLTRFYTLVPPPPRATPPPGPVADEAPPSATRIQAKLPHFFHNGAMLRGEFGAAHAVHRLVQEYNTRREFLRPRQLIPREVREVIRNSPTKPLPFDRPTTSVQHLANQRVIFIQAALAAGPLAELRPKQAFKRARAKAERENPALRDMRTEEAVEVFKALLGPRAAAYVAADASLIFVVDEDNFVTVLGNGGPGFYAAQSADDAAAALANVPATNVLANRDRDYTTSTESISCPSDSAAFSSSYDHGAHPRNTTHPTTVISQSEHSSMPALDAASEADDFPAIDRSNIIHGPPPADFLALVLRCLRAGGLPADHEDFFAFLRRIHLTFRIRDWATAVLPAVEVPPWVLVLDIALEPRVN